LSDADISTEIHVGKALMPGFAAIASDQVKALVDYVRTFQR
jgi:mono/diheme cytochrome c family protein